MLHPLSTPLPRPPTLLEDIHHLPWAYIEVDAGASCGDWYPAISPSQGSWRNIFETINQMFTHLPAVCQKLTLELKIQISYPSSEAISVSLGSYYKIPENG